jgi:glycosyltransferase involved in cell wall biosynthesis
LNLRIPTPAAIFAYAFARVRGKPIFSLVVSDLRALLPFMPYRGVRRGLWHAYTAFEERNVQRIADHSLAFANGAALALKHSRGGHHVIEIRTTTIDARDIAERDDACERGCIRILTVSRLDPRKGLRILPAALQRLVSEGVDATIDIVGPTAGSPGVAERRAIEADARARGVADRVRLVGAVPLDALIGRYREYDLFVLPTLPGEGIPRVLLEAMAGGVPVVTTRVAGIPSLVAHEQNGLLVDEPTADAVSSALLRLVRDAALRRRLIAEGYATARAHTLPAQAAEMMAAVASGLRVELRRAAPPQAAW